MAMAVEIERTLVHAVPGAERIMAEHQPYAIELQLAIGVHACPAGQAGCVGTVIVAGDQMLDAVESRQQRGHALRWQPIGEIAEMPHHVIAADAVVPARHQCLVHFGDRGEGPREATERAAMAKMRVGGEPDRHTSSGHGTIVDLTVFIAMASATARWIPFSSKG